VDETPTIVALWVTVYRLPWGWALPGPVVAVHGALPPAKVPAGMLGGRLGGGGGAFTLFEDIVNNVVAGSLPARLAMEIFWGSAAGTPGRRKRLGGGHVFGDVFGPPLGCWVWGLSVMLLQLGVSWLLHSGEPLMEAVVDTWAV